MRLKTVEKDRIKFSFINEEEFEELYKALFFFKEYPFRTSNKSPFILDCGSHIGISILYFKKLYPNAKIIGFEPNPNTFELLKLNVEQNNLENVQLINCALCDKEGEIDFYISRYDDSWRTGNSAILSIYEDNESKKIKVGAKQLSQFIDKPVDLIKLDIEGMEEKVLKEIQNKLPLVKEIEMEFHGLEQIEQLNNIENIVSMLKTNNFEFKIVQDGKNIRENEINKIYPYGLGVIAKNTSHFRLQRQLI